MGHGSSIMLRRVTEFVKGLRLGWTFRFSWTGFESKTKDDRGADKVGGKEVAPKGESHAR